MSQSHAATDAYITAMADDARAWDEAYMQTIRETIRKIEFIDEDKVRSIIAELSALVAKDALYGPDSTLCEQLDGFHDEI